MHNLERVKTGISTLDEILLGGFPRGSIILVAGGPGTGKTIFAAQFIHSGATKYNEKGVYVSLGVWLIKSILLAGLAMISPGM